MEKTMAINNVPSIGFRQRGVFLEQLRRSCSVMHHTRRYNRLRCLSFDTVAAVYSIMMHKSLLLIVLACKMMLLERRRARSSTASNTLPQL